MRTVNFKGMTVRHLDDGRFEIVPPLFLWWAAKHVILTFLISDVFLSIFFLLNSSNLFASLLLGSILLSMLFAVGYKRESFLVIYIHFVYCLLYIVACSLVIPIVYYNQKVCNYEKCRMVSEWMREIGLPIVAIWVYFFTGVTIISHALMAPVSLRMMKYAATREALERMMSGEEYAKYLRNPAVKPAPSRPIPV